MRKHWRLVLLFAAFVGVVLCVVWMLPPVPGVTEANFRRVQEGMSVEQVEAILGSPGEDPITCIDATVPSGPDGSSPRVWFGPGAFIVVYFGPDGLVQEKTLLGGAESLLDRWRRWLFGE